MSRWSRFVRVIRDSIDRAWQDKSAQYQDWRESVFQMDNLESRTMLATFGGNELVTVSIDNTAVFEGSDPANPNSAVFTVTLSGPLLVSTTVGYATFNSSAQAGLDYTATSGTVTFAPGETQKTISVPIIPNISPQPDRAFFVRLTTSGIVAPILKQQGHCTIVDDDGNTIVTVTATTPAASESGTAGVFQLARTGPTDKAMRVSFALKGTAQNGVDYSKVGSYAVIPAGQSSVNVTITPTKDTIKEPTEDVILKLKASKLYEVTQIENFATVTITDADATAPAAKLTAPPLTKAAPTYKFIVRYTDDRALDVASIATGSIRVTGPKSYSQDAKLVKKRSSKNKRLVVATYAITGPAGAAWAKSDNGTYTVSLVANQVKDATGNAAGASSLGTFAVQIS